MLAVFIDHYHYSYCFGQAPVYPLKLVQFSELEIYYANVDDIGVNLQPVKIKHMANHK